MNRSAKNGSGRARGSDLAREIGHAIKSAREAANLSQAELGKKLKTRNGTALDRTKISSYERGEYIPEPRLRVPMADALNVAEVDLFGPLASGPERDSLFTRLAKVERRLESVERILQGQGLDLALGSDAEDAARVATQADVRDEESATPPQRSPSKRPSKGRQR